MDFYEKKEGEHQLYNTPLEKWALFFLVAMGILTLTYGVLFLIDFLPEKPSDTTRTETVATKDTGTSTAITKATTTPTAAKKKTVANAPAISDENAKPIAIIFDTLDNKRVSILNPSSTNIDVLNNALLSGVVRYPGTADFKNEGTIFLFGHSSYLPKVINKNFQAFNGIQKLKWGDTIRLQSKTMEYVYRVDQVYQVKAADTEVKIVHGQPKLTLATCNVFGSKDDRYVVEATLVESHTI